MNKTCLQCQTFTLYIIINRKFGQFYRAFQSKTTSLLISWFYFPPTFFLCKIKTNIKRLLSIKILTTQQTI